jgi:thiosulfate reductase/polysulfide reductase chain A
MLEYARWQMRNIRELRELASDPAAELHPTTAGEYGVSNGDWIFVETKKGKIKEEKCQKS